MPAKERGPVAGTITHHNLQAYAANLGAVQAAAFTVGLGPTPHCAALAAVVQAMRAGAAVEAAVHVRPYAPGAAAALEASAAVDLAAAYKAVCALAPAGNA